MKNIFYILLLLPTIIFAQYPNNSGHKITLGEQTTADGLIWRGVAATDTLVRKPSIDTMAYMVLDTTTNIMWHYKKQTSNAWLRLNLLPSDTASMLTPYWRSGRFSGVLPVANGGTNSTTLTANKVMVGNGTSGVLTPTNLHWDNTNSRLGIETGSPNAKLEINDASTNSILRISSGTNNSLRGLEWYNNNSANVYGSIKSDYTSGVFIYDAGNSVYAGVHAFRIGTSGEAMRITSAGNVGIGTPSPGSRLVVKGVNNTSGESALNVTNSSNNSLLFVRNDGNVGIGTASPVSLLHIEGSGPILTMNRTSGSFSNTINFKTSGIDYASIISNAGNGEQRYSIGPEVAFGGFHTFYTDTDERMRITSSGNVGIGTPSPGNLLTIKDKSQIGFRDEASNYTRNALQNYAYTSGYGDGLRIGEQYNAVSIGGNVGIGTTNPTFKLDVTGTGRFSADVTSSGASQNLFIADGTTYSGLRLNRAGVAKWAIFNNNAGTDFLDFYWYGSSPGTKFKIEPTGAATFSSTIKVGDGAASSNIEKLMVNTVSGTSAGIQLFQDGVESWIIRNPASSTALTFSASNQTRLTIASTGAATFSSLATGTVYSSSGTLTNTPPSDERLKNNINNISWGLSDILKLRPVSFNWKDDKISQGKQFGFIAQEVREVMPEAIKIFGEDVKYLGLEKDAIYATLVKAVQELSAQVDMLKQEIINLKNK